MLTTRRFEDETLHMVFSFTNKLWALEFNILWHVDTTTCVLVCGKAIKMRKSISLPAPVNMKKNLLVIFCAKQRRISAILFADKLSRCWLERISFFRAIYIVYDDANSNDIEEDKGKTWNISSLFFGIVIEFNSLEDDATVKSENSFSPLSVNEPNPPEMAKISNYAISSGITFVCSLVAVALFRRTFSDSTSRERRRRLVNSSTFFKDNEFLSAGIDN